MSRDLKAIADRIGTTASQLLDRPQDVRLQAALLNDIQLVSEQAKSSDLPIFIRSVARDVEERASAVAHAIEPGADAWVADRERLAATIEDLRHALVELLVALEHGRG